MVFFISLNCSCGQPILTTAIECAKANSDAHFNQYAESMPEQLKKEVREGKMSRECLNCKKPFFVLETQMWSSPSIQTLAAANRFLSKGAQGFTQVVIPAVN